MKTNEEGDMVLDPFLGSGQVAIISKMLKRQYIGFEVVKEYYEFAKERLEKDIYRIKSNLKENISHPTRGASQSYPLHPEWLTVQGSLDILW